MLQIPYVEVRGLEPLRPKNLIYSQAGQPIAQHFLKFVQFFN